MASPQKILAEKATRKLLNSITEKMVRKLWMWELWAGTAHVIRRHLTCALDALPHYFFSQNQGSLHLLSLHSMKVKSKRKVIHKKSRKLQTIHPTFISSITLIRFQVTQHTNFQMKGGQSFKPSIAVRTYRTQQPPSIMIIQT